MREWDLKVKRLEVAMLSSLDLICAQVKYVLLTDLFLFL